MVTTVGKEEGAVELLYDLIELEYDAIEAYQAAVTRIERSEDKIELGRFMSDHERHVTELSAAIQSLGGRAPLKADMKSILTKGKVVLAGLVGDRAILMAMKSNEEDTNSAYERAAARDFGAPLRELFERNLADERRHRAWIVHRLEVLERVS